jgi:hypothetical protein
MAIANIADAESGLSVRTKLNLAIGETNYLNTGFFPKIDLSPQSGYYANANSAILTSSGVLGSFELLTLEEGRSYTIQGFNSGFTGLSYFAYAYDSGGINGQKIFTSQTTPIEAGAFSFVVPTGRPKIGLICYVADISTITLALGSTIAEASTAQLKPDSLANANFFSRIDNQYYGGLSTKFIGGVFAVYAQIPFDTGTVEPTIGASLSGAVSGASYVILDFELLSGTFAAGDAAGNIIVQANANYLSNPYSSGENLQISASTIAVKTAAAASGRWWQIGGSHVPLNVESKTVHSASGFQINHDIGVTNVIVLTATPDETLSLLGYVSGASVGTALSFITVRKLKANTTTGVITSDAVDWTDLNNAINGGNIWVFGIAEV